MLLKDNGEDTLQDGQKEGNVGSQEEDELKLQEDVKEKEPLFEDDFSQNQDAQ